MLTLRIGIFSEYISWSTCYHSIFLLGVGTFKKMAYLLLCSPLRPCSRKMAIHFSNASLQEAWVGLIGLRGQV